MDNVKNEEITLFRFGVIFPLLGGTSGHGQKSKMIAELAAKEYEIPGSMRRILSKSTIYLWLAAYQGRGLEGLCPQTRSDKGGFRKISTETELALREYKDRHPDWKLTTLVKIAAREGVLLPSERIPMSVVYRVFKDYNKEKKARSSKDMRRFEMENCNDVWMLLCRNPELFRPLTERCNRLFPFVSLDGNCGIIHLNEYHKAEPSYAHILWHPSQTIHNHLKSFR